MRSVTRACDVCGKDYEAKNSRSRFCSGTCRVKNRRQTVEMAAAPPIPQKNGLIEAVERDLAAAGRLHTSTGQQALVLVERFMAEHSGNAVAALSRELRTVLSEALAGASEADPIDEVRRQRESTARQAAS